jgi:hypothetical protein
MFGESETVEKEKIYTNINQDNWYKDISMDLLKHNIIPTFSSVIVEAKTIKNCDFNTPLDAYLDWWLWMQIACENKVYYLNNKLTLWRKHAISYTRTSDDINSSNNIFKNELYNMFLKKLNGQKIGIISKIRIYIKILIMKLLLNKRFNKIFRGLTKLLILYFIFI